VLIVLLAGGGWHYGPEWGWGPPHYLGGGLGLVLLILLILVLLGRL
jgi:hypothetical protein